MKNYVPIPTDFYRRPEAVRLILREHCSGIGAYVMILSYLRDCDGYRCSAAAEEVAFAANIVDIDLCARVISDYGLFAIDEDGMLYSPWLQQLMTSYDDTRAKRRAAGRASAAARQADTNSAGEGVNTSATSVGDVLNTNATSVGDVLNNTLYNNNNIKHNITQPNKQYHELDLGGGVIFSASDIARLCCDDSPSVGATQRIFVANRYGEGNTQMQVYEAAKLWGMTVRQFDWLYRLTDKFRGDNATYQELLKLCRDCLRDKFVPRYPLNYILSKLSIYNNTNNN